MHSAHHPTLHIIAILQAPCTTNVAKIPASRRTTCPTNQMLSKQSWNRRSPYCNISTNKACRIIGTRSVCHIMCPSTVAARTVERLGGLTGGKFLLATACNATYRAEGLHCSHAPCVLFPPLAPKLRSRGELTSLVAAKTQREENRHTVWPHPSSFVLQLGSLALHTKSGRKYSDGH